MVQALAEGDADAALHRLEASGQLGGSSGFCENRSQQLDGITARG
jgi:hypothetical protein